jgi:hypothetical protein
MSGSGQLKFPATDGVGGGQADKDERVCGRRRAVAPAIRDSWVDVSAAQSCACSRERPV